MLVSSLWFCLFACFSLTLGGGGGGAEKNLGQGGGGAWTQEDTMWKENFMHKKNIHITEPALTI